jgi:hypothetical protein
MPTPEPPRPKAKKNCGCPGGGGGGSGGASGGGGGGGGAVAMTKYSGGSERMKLPFLKFFWFDKYSRKRCTIIVHCPSGAFRKGALNGYIRDNKRVHIIYDYSHLKILEPKAYNKAFKEPSGDLMYDSEHARTVQHADVIRIIKKDNRLTKCKAEMIIEVEEEVENDWCNEEGFDGWQVFKCGPAANPQIFAHIELMCKRTAFNNRQPVGGYEDFLSSGSEDSA